MVEKLNMQEIIIRRIPRRFGTATLPYSTNG